MKPCETKPYSHLYPGTGVDIEDTLTKREYFAALILQGFCSFPVSQTDKELGGQVDWFEHRANCAVKQADALIKALNKETKE